MVSYIATTMKLLSEQIRDLVKESSTSAYAIARAAEIDKSAMSRFMNGGRLTMEKLDQLARVLGVTVSSDEISLVPRPLEKGRPKQKKETKMTKQQAQKYADAYANDAHDNYFESRRGIWYFEDLDCLVLYDNNPPANDDELRPKIMKLIQSRLKKVGIKTLACGGSDEKLSNGDPYTVTLLLDCSRDRKNEVIEIATEAIKSLISRD